MNTAFRFSTIDLKKEKESLLKEIKQIFEEVGAHNSKAFNEAYWNWGYMQVPNYESKVFTIWDKEKIIGYYHFTFHKGYIGGEEKLLASMQDLAVSPNYRGQGLFNKLSHYAHEEISASDVQLMYGFPNKKSIGGFLKYNNFTAISEMPVLVRPTKTAKVIKARINLLGLEKVLGWVFDSVVNIISKRVSLKSAKVIKLNGISDQVAALYTEYQSQFKNYIVRDKSWLEWRYQKSLRGKHHFFCVKEKDELTAFVIVKEDLLFGNNTLVIMDFAHALGKETSLLFLIDALRENKQLIQYDFDFVLISALTPLLSKLKTIGFINVPSKFNPRTLTMIARTASNLDIDKTMSSSNWLITLGDWDVL